MFEVSSILPQLFGYSCLNFVCDSLAELFDFLVSQWCECLDLWFVLCCFFSIYDIWVMLLVEDVFYTRWWWILWSVLRLGFFVCLTYVFGFLCFGNSLRMSVRRELLCAYGSRFAGISVGWGIVRIVLQLGKPGVAVYKIRYRTSIVAIRGLQARQWWSINFPFKLCCNMVNVNVGLS